MSDTARNATLADLAGILRSQEARKLDVVAPARTLRSEGGVLVVEGTEAILGPDGVTSADGRYRPTSVGDEGLAEKLGIPRAYLRRLRDEKLGLFDLNVNGWLHGDEPRSFLVRTFRPDDEGGEGVLRAFLSPGYRRIDNLDVLTAALEGVQAAGVEVEVRSTDLTERRMYVKIHSPAVAELAPDLLDGYRSPYSGATGSENPTVFAGFVISNSEVGGGAFSITPQLVVAICANGMTLTREAFRSVHLGARQEDGIVRASEETLEANLNLVRAQAKDAVATFLDPAYVRAQIGRMTEQAAEHAGVDRVQEITRSLSYPEERTNAVLDFFVQGGQTTTGGVAQAISAAAQAEADADVAADMEAHAASLLVG